MKVLSLKRSSTVDFEKVLAREDLRPVILVSIDANREPVLTLGDTTFREIGYVLFALSAHFQHDFLEGCDE